MKQEETPKRRRYSREKNGIGLDSNDLIRKYGISRDEYNKMFLEQEGKCKICGKHQSEFSRALHVDHLHVEDYKSLPWYEKRKYVRGLLCFNCNNGLANFKENRELFLKALEYLEAQ